MSRFSLLLVAGLVATGLKLPWRLGALVFLVAAAVVGVMALAAVVRAAARPSAVVAVSVGLGATALMLLVQALLLLYWTPTMTLQRCQDRAVTPSAAQQCQADYTASIRSVFGSGATFGP